MKNVMKKAWEIAKEGSAKFGGKASEYISAALKMAWAEIKKGANQMAELPKIVNVRAKELFQSGDQPSMQYAKSKAEHEFSILITNAKKINASSGKQVLPVEKIYELTEKSSVKDYLKFMSQVDLMAGNLSK
ncbi:hypothetical protein QT711_03290 [Sporosarcina saromensis]|uniref:Uncharacterized protein n=1 Tax=Sporosarcina saromensis TaxID=359365 RepID=A0ABU4G5H4_9BACL|nr:hypothetical protein [Sporosarcina saromensis]MDW0112194.1 hypothetical protein [Sporosarcina saromensis]